MTDSPGRNSWNASGGPPAARPQAASKGTLWKQIQEASVKTFHQVRDALDEQPPPHAQPASGRVPQPTPGQPRPLNPPPSQAPPASASAAAAAPSAQTLNSTDSGSDRKQSSTPAASPREKSINGDAATAPASSAPGPAAKPKARRGVPSFKMPAELPADAEALKELLQSANQYLQYVEEDRGNMLTSISTMAQDMANIRMSSTDSSSQVTKMQQEIDTLKKDCAEKESAIQKLKERVKFAAVDQAQQELKKSKAECTALQEKLAACATKEKELNDTIEEYKREVVALEKEKEVLRTAHIDAAKKAETLMRKEEECKELTAKLDQLTQEHQGSIVAHAEQIANMEKQAEIKMDEMEAQRRNYKVKAESIQRDLAKIVKIDAKYKAENQRLQEELQRKTKSLKDAIEALGTYMAKEDAHIEKSALRMAKDGVKVINKAVGSVGNAVVKTAKAAASLATNSPAPVPTKRPIGSPASSTASAPTGQARGQPRRRPASGSPNGADPSDPVEDQLP